MYVSGMDNNQIPSVDSMINEAQPAVEPAPTPAVQSAPVVQPAPAPTPTPAPAPVAPPQQSEVKLSGTATEEEIQIDATKPKEEVLDEYEIKMDVIAEKKRNRRNWIFILIVVFIIVAFIFAMPYIIKRIGY